MLVYTKTAANESMYRAQHAIPYATSHLRVVIIDTAGRLHINETLMMN